MKKIFYRVQKGESLISVSNKFCVPIFDLINLNGLKNEIEAGDILIIEKTSNCYKVGVLDTLESVAQKFGLTPERLSFINGGITYVFYGLTLKI